MNLYIITWAAFVAVFCLPSSEGTAYQIQTKDELDENDNCVKHVKIEGDGIKDSFSTSCKAEINRESLMNGVLLVGDYTKQRFSVFSDTPSSMVAIRGEDDKQCQKRTYSPGHREAEKMSSKDCKKYKKRVSAEWRGLKKKRSHSKLHFTHTHKSTRTVNQNMYVITNFIETEKGKKCSGEMELGRSKLRYVEKYDDCRPRRIVFIPEGVIVGDYTTIDGVTRISDTVDTIVSLYPNRICDKIIFKKKGGSWAIDSVPSLEKEVCDKYIEKVTGWLRNSKDTSGDNEIYSEDINSLKGDSSKGDDLKEELSEGDTSKGSTEGTSEGDDLQEESLEEDLSKGSKEDTLKGDDLKGDLPEAGIII